MRTCTLLSLVVLWTAACGTSPQDTSDRSTVPVRLYVFDGGILASDPTRYRLTEAEVQSVPLSIAMYLVVHPRGVLLWDAGAVSDQERSSTAADVEQRVVRADGAERVVTLGPPFLDQLRAAGHSPADVTHLALSHYHWDHTADANAFSHATWLVRQVERDVMFGGAAPGAARPATYAGLKDSRTVIVTAEEHDVFGDGTVMLKHAPGHSEGHQVLYVNLPQTGGVVLSGDLYHYREERTLGRLPTFEVDVNKTEASRREVDAFLTRTGAALWIQHDLVGHRELRKAPAFYE